MFSSSFSTPNTLATRAPRSLRERSSSLGAVRCLVSALLVTGVAVTNSYAQTPACKVNYTTAWQGGTGFGANIDITNNGPAITNGWTLVVSFPSGQTLQNGWPVAFSQSGAQMTVASNAQWNQSIASGATFSVGFNGSFSGTNTTPTQFTLNGTACNGGGNGGGPNTPPTVSLTSPTASQTFAAGAAVPLAATASDPGGAVVRVEFRVDGTLVSTATTAPFTFSATGLAAGNHTVTATAFDNGTPALSTATSAVAFTVGGGGNQNTPPSVSLTSPTASQAFAAGATVPLSATASDPGGAVARVEFRVDGTLVNTATTPPYTFNATGLTAGNHTVTATAVDNGTPALSTATTAVSFSIGGATAASVFRVNAQGRITKNGTVFPVRCGNWFGLEGRHEPSNDATNPSGAPMEQYIGNTFWANGGAGTGRTIQQTMTEISGMGINMIRLPLVPQTLDPNDPQGTGNVLKNHASVRIANSRLALETMIKAAAANNIQVLLDIHSCSNFVGWRKGRFDARPPYVDAHRDNYDFTRETYSCSATNNPASVTHIQAYDKTKWLATLQTLAGLGAQLGVDNIIGIDLFNEPWDYTWADWKTNVEDAYQAINAVNPNILIFAEGVSGTANNQDGTPDTITQEPHGLLTPNWGENLFSAGANPPNVPKDRLVFSPHSYGPSVAVQSYFLDPNQTACVGLEGDAAGDAKCKIVIDPAKLKAGWEEHYGYLKDMGYAVVVGEFGGNLDWPAGQASIRDRNRWGFLAPGTDSDWQNAFVDYLATRHIEGCYWSINPESGDTGGWYGHAYDPVTNTAGWGEWRPFDQRKTNLLNKLWTANAP
ncbi:MAG TPA: cellulase family glycosylhydrolase [Steroidobacteraceae bacterium]